MGLNIRRIRRDLNMSQQVLADRIGLTFQQVQKYERGANRVSASKLVAIAKALGVSPASLLPDSQAAAAEPWQTDAQALYLRCPKVFEVLLKLPKRFLDYMIRTAECVTEQQAEKLDEAEAPKLQRVA
ncbi:helix-turn-helix family protein [Asticcacaulis biprosthecium C19]|uniref:Helix-turn-helix family protein n=1 Tax=Asticcacaulis biprosthecium C19 TaxID=715226 RepID=F4QJ21_9CAUL|nr:helix-turn-helix family protein [Asticcacaulis biprosthecium C19]